jgi:hypothetical protein
MESKFMPKHFSIKKSDKISVKLSETDIKMTVVNKKPCSAIQSKVSYCIICNVAN